MREMKIKTRLKWQALLSVMVIITAQGFSCSSASTV